MSADKPAPKPPHERRLPREPWDHLGPDEPAEAPPRTGLAGFLERLGKLFQLHPRGPFGS